MVRIGNVTNHLAIGDQRSRRVVEGAFLLRVHWRLLAQGNGMQLPVDIAVEEVRDGPVMAVLQIECAADRGLR